MAIDLVLGQKHWQVSTAWRVGFVAPALLAIAAALFALARRFDRLPRFVRRRPQIALHLAFWAAFSLLWLGPGGEEPRAHAHALLLMVLPFLLWRIGYLLKSAQRGKVAGTHLGDHLFYLFPLWRGSETPYGKGLDNLVRFESADATELARSQLAGVKCLLLALVAQLGIFLMSGLVFAEAKNPLGSIGLGVPHLDDLVRRRAETPWALAWLGIYCDLVWSTLRLAAKGHVAVGILRLLGFRVLRNTYKPLLATSVLDFWNRYHFYFKEVLAEFFFYPTYTRAKGAPWLRTLLAVFAAAFVGNLYYHLLQQDEALLAGDFRHLAAAFSSRILYCFLLASGIFVSMMREQRRRGRTSDRPSTWVRLRRIAGVWTFFALIHVWAHASPEPSLAERGAFFLSLFAL